MRGEVFKFCRDFSPADVVIADEIIPVSGSRGIAALFIYNLPIKLKNGKNLYFKADQIS